MLNTLNEETNTVLYSDLACFVNRLTLNIYVSVIYSVKQAGNVIRIRVAVPEEYVNIYSTRRVGTGDTR